MTVHHLAKRERVMKNINSILESLAVNEDSFIRNSVMKEIQKIAKKYGFVASPSGKYDCIVSGKFLQLVITFNSKSGFDVKGSFHSTPTESDFKIFGEKMNDLCKENNNFHYFYTDLYNNSIINR